MKKPARKFKVRRGTIRKVIETPNVLAILDVPTIYALEMPDEPILEAKTVKLLDEARRRTKVGDTNWLKKHGARVYVAEPAASVLSHEDFSDWEK
jgi:hypothetical protein